MTKSPIPYAKSYTAAAAAAALALTAHHATAELIGHWPLDDGAGDFALDASGNLNDGIIANVDLGGLGESGTAWVDDPERGTVLSFNGINGSGTYVTIGDAFIPAMDLANDFSWALWVKPGQPPNTNDIIFGNRFDIDGFETDPREFIKFTPRAFEWHWDGIGENADYEDMPQGVWGHHVVVKSGDELFYYRNGVLDEFAGNFISGAPANPQPLFIGGQGAENWAGYISDVRVYSHALTPEEIDALAEFDFAPVFPAPEFEIAPATAGGAYSYDLAPEAVDPEGAPVEFSKISGPDWVSVSEAGLVTGTPLASDAGLNEVVVGASDGGKSSQAVARIVVAGGGGGGDGLVEIDVATFAPLDSFFFDIEVTVADHPNRMLVVAAGYEGNGTVTAAWWGNEIMEEVTSFKEVVSSVALFYLPMPAAGTRSITLDTNGTIFDDTDIQVGVFSLHNADQAMPAAGTDNGLTTSAAQVGFTALPAGSFGIDLITVNNGGKFFTWGESHVELFTGNAGGGSTVGCSYNPNLGPGDAAMFTTFEENRCAYAALAVAPAGSGGGGPAGDFIVTEITTDDTLGEVTLTWNSEPGKTYAIDYSDDLTGWPEAVDGINSGGSTTTATVPAALGLNAPDGRRHYRVREK